MSLCEKVHVHRWSRKRHRSLLYKTEWCSRVCVRVYVSLFTHMYFYVVLCRSLQIKIFSVIQFYVGPYRFALSLSLFHAHNLSLHSLSLSFVRYFSLTHSLSLSRTRTLTRTHTYTHSKLTHTLHTHSLSLSLCHTHAYT